MRDGSADQDLSATLIRDAACVTSIEELGLPGSQSFLADATQLSLSLPDSFDPPAGWDRSTSATRSADVDAPRLAAEYPRLVMFGLEPRLLDLIERYLGVPAAFTSVHCRRDFGDGLQAGIGYWHLDTEDAKILRLLVYLERVTANDGPFEYIPLVHEARCAELRARALSDGSDPRFNPVTDADMRSVVPEPQWKTVTGPRWTAILVDAAALFHHAKPHRGRRTAITYSYTSRAPNYPKLQRNAAFDSVLTSRQADCMYVPSAR